MIAFESLDRLRELPATRASVDDLLEWLLTDHHQGQRFVRAHERIARILWLRYCADPPWTFAQIAAELGMDPMHAQQRRLAGLRHLRVPSRLRQIEASGKLDPRSRLGTVIYAGREIHESQV